MEAYTNELIKESSPYLLQHAHNPVNWVAWSDEAFEKAKLENKLVLVSIGYSACHWCHVMEHESFEDEEVAALMNKFFVCIKVDREERPDVDQVYMSAVQLMTQQGGWPLNCFTLADGKPIYGGTYFQKENWMHVLKSLEYTFKNKPKEVELYANNLQEGVQNSELIHEPIKETIFTNQKLEELVLRWSKSFDIYEGGSSRAPKFPLPSNYQFLLQYAHLRSDENILKHVELTLDKMAYGGIYDQVAGGFARYSVDMLWKVPHFEKMLYDNGQLLSLYAEGYKKFKKPLYKRIIYQTKNWLEKEMTSHEGAFFSALDADSEGVEGKFYTWTSEELEVLFGNDFEFVKDIYNINQLGFWEEEHVYILMRNVSDKVICKKYHLSTEEFELKIEAINQKFLDERNHRIRPGTDDKCLTSWNAITIKGLCDSYCAFGDKDFLVLAHKNLKWLVENQLKSDGSLFRNFKNGKATIEGFLEDYCHVIDALIAYYQATFEVEWIELANKLMKFTRVNFQDSKSKMFYFTPSDTKLIARKMELNDNVLPASNSVMARNLYKLGRIYCHQSYIDESKQMLTNIYDGMEMYGSGYSNWAILLQQMIENQVEICFVGKNAIKEALNFQKEYHPIPLILGGLENQLPLLKNKKEGIQTLIYICKDKVCQLPLTEI
ncbi:MAG: thioredoxin domain-containing protein [Flavobacteriia bacterium]|nr:thioredoxin domain-containing protein [Flavobacteriia bacterium]